MSLLIIHLLPQLSNQDTPHIEGIYVKKKGHADDLQSSLPVFFFILMNKPHKMKIIKFLF